MENTSKTPAAAQTVGGMRQRRVARGAKNSGKSGEQQSGADSGNNQGAQQSIMKFYSDDGTGLKVGPVTVLVMSLSFMCVVVLLHILQKFKMALS